ncbi:MAG: hypothetical protein Q7U56_04345 [Humidesulfovibrio sp.]|nr:hypothetical protein [Humidesulfovibrio sp.]
MSQREKRLREFAALGILPWLPKPGESCASCPTPGVVVRLKPFFIKAAVVTLLFLGAVTVIGQGLGVAGRQLEEKISGVGSWTPEKMEHERARAHAFAEKLRPVLRELIFVFRDTPEESAAGTGDKGR